jgi:AraC-like DNA-binding protein
MDALSDVLRLARLSGGVFLEAEFSAPWCVLSQVGPEDCSPFVAPASRLIAYHYVLAGEMLVRVGAGEPMRVRAGEILMLPRNDPHTIASDLGAPLVSAEALVQPSPAGGLKRIVHGGGGALTHIVCGYLASDAPHDLLMAALPRLLTLDVGGAAERAWIESSFRLASSELAANRAGAQTVLSKLSELLFVEAVRRHLAAIPESASGWIAGLRDPHVGRALALLHERPAEAWRVEELARRVGLSRTALADRFVQLVGEPPIRYLARWRMQLAQDLLRDSTRGLAEIAARVGYESEAAFSRAFKREFGASPAAWRRGPRALTPPPTAGS